MRALPAFLLPLVLAVAGLSCRAPEATITLRASLLVAEGHTWYEAFAYFGNILEERSGGRLRLEVYPAEQLAKEIEAIRMIQAGVIDMTTTGALLSNWTPVMAFAEMPFLADDMAAVDSMLTGRLGERIRADMLADTGLRPVGYFQAGPRHLTSKRPVRTPADLFGLTVRIPSIPAFVTAWEALGAKPTTIAFSEVFTALQQGVINAQENPLPLTEMLAMYEVQDYVNLTSHVFGWTHPVIGEAQFQALPDDLKPVFLACAADMQAFERARFRENADRTRRSLEAKGMTFVEVDRAAFEAKLGDAVYRTLPPELQTLYRELKGTAQ